jgi:DNA polymerase-3 subunit delta'
VIVDPADDMNVNAANALLKTLEEPPARTLFVLISHSLGALLPTIRSRCQTVKLKPLPPAVLLQALKSLNAEMPETEAALNALADRAGGSVRDALLLTQYGGLDIAEAVSDAVSAKAFAVASAARVADAVGGRDNAVQFSIFNQTVLDLIARKAHIAATQDQLETAHRYSEFWRETDRMIFDTDTYNLDKRQHVMGLLRRMWQISNS